MTPLLILTLLLMLLLYLLTCGLFAVDLSLTTSTQVQLVPGFPFAGRLQRFSTIPNSAASLTSGLMVSTSSRHQCLYLSSFPFSPFFSLPFPYPFFSLPTFPLIPPHFFPYLPPYLFSARVSAGTSSA